MGLMKSVHVRFLGLIAGLVGSLLILRVAHKTINLELNGKKTTVTTFALTVGGFLRSNQISTSAPDQIEPPLRHWLQDGDTISIERAAQIRVQDGEEYFTLFATERVPANLLASTGIEIFPGDQLISDGQPLAFDEPLPRSQSHSLQIRRAKEIPISKDGDSQTILSSAGTLGRALWDTGILLYTKDHLEPDIETPLTNPLRVSLNQSKELYIHFLEDSLHIRTTAGTVGEALSGAGIALQGSDFSLPPENASLPAGGNIRVVRVKESVAIETEPIPFDTQFQPQSDLELDGQKVVQPGTYGIKANRVRIRYEDGEEVSRELEGEYLAQEPNSRIIGYGTKIVPHTANTPGGQIKYWRALSVHAVSYNPTSAGGNTTASGLPLRKGVVAVDTSYIPLGTRLYIPGYGEGVAADTGGGIKGRIIDLGYGDSDYVPWHKWVTLYFLWPPPENVVPVIP
jgi:uncharacterized protein YabE (DUF348 family)